MENSTLENKRIEIGQLSLGYLETTRKWTMFFAILGFVVVGILLILGIVAGSFLSSFTSKMSGMGGMEGMEGMEGSSGIGGIASIFIFIIILIYAVIVFFPLFYLFRFSRHTKNAVANLDAQELELGLKNLKSYWRYIGIFTIIALCFYVIVLIVAGGSLAILSGLKG